MPKERYLGVIALDRSDDGSQEQARTPIRDITPGDGAVVQSGDLTSVFCAPCQRWIDCQADIPTDIALDRHRSLVH